MTQLKAIDVYVNNRDFDNTEKDAFDALYQELREGIQSTENGELYTIEGAWEEIDKI